MPSLLRPRDFLGRYLREISDGAPALEWISAASARAVLTPALPRWAGKASSQRS